MSIPTPSITFGRLQDLAPREAWAHEAHAFTPWLATNIDQLSEAIGISLELTGQEVRVERFAADILARNADAEDDSVVLIENQLEETDHKHLGQIMTYLAGLNAKTVVWIAPAFREPHLSAIRWLNQNTAEGFAFFAVRLRVVQIADSPYAPIFEVLEKPNEWERQLHTVVPERGSLIPVRSNYWASFDSAFPSNGTVEIGRHRIFIIDEDEGVCIKLGIKRDRATIWVGLASASYLENYASSDEFRQWFGSRLPSLEAALGPLKRTKKFAAFTRGIACDLCNPDSWPDTIKWHADQLHKYRNAFGEAKAGETEV